MSKFLIAGLGNIGAEYAGTRHNIGFDILDFFVGEKAPFKSDRYASVSEMSLKGKKMVLIKPSTYMNLSGKAVRYWMQAENIPIENLLVIYDDIALPEGVIRMRNRGSAGGHNGIENIIEVLGGDTFPRLRFGIGNDFPRGFQVDYVLGRWTTEQQKILKDRIPKAAEAIQSFILEGAARAMNKYNG